MSFYKIIVLIIFYSTYITANNTSDMSTHHVVIEGEKHFEKEDLYKALDIKTKSFFQFWKENSVKIDDKLIPSIHPSLSNFYNSEGFYDAVFKIKETNTTLTININENLPVKVNEINISSDYKLDTIITLKKGMIFRAKDFIEVKKNIMIALLNEGYCSYDLNTKAYVDLDTHRVNLFYRLKKGEYCTFGETNVKGLNTINSKIIQSKVIAKKGERFNPLKIKQSYTQVYGLDAFDSVVVNTDRKFYNVVPIDIELKELKKPYHYEVGVGYDTFVGARIHGLFSKRNFLGNAQKITFKASWSQKEQMIGIDFYKPYLFEIFNYGIDFGLEFGYSNLEYIGFQEKKRFLNTFLEHNEGRLKLKAGLGLENIEISLLNNYKNNIFLKQAINAGTFVLFYPYLHAVFDARDDKLNPKFGYFLSGYIEYGIPYNVNASVYKKALLEGRYIYTYEKLTFSSVGKLGIVDQTKHAIPESKLLFAGGSFYNRAYGYNSIGVILSPTSDSIQGASTLMNLSVEINYPILGDLYGAVFNDNTMLTAQSYNFDGEIITSAGIGVRYVTPIGPFKLDIGWNVHDTAQYGISFQIGQSF